MPRLSLCLIAKNESHFLPGCLASVRGIVDEVIVVDTGSTDDTIAVAKAAGAKVYELPWADDFSAPRNFALSKATGDFILHLDADERLAPGAKQALQALMRHGDVDCAMVKLHDANSEAATPEDVLSGAARLGDPLSLPRVLRNVEGLAWPPRAANCNCALGIGTRRCRRCRWPPSASRTTPTSTSSAVGRWS